MFTISDIAEATGGRVIGVSEGEVNGISTDSRSVISGELFVPLRGTSYDGHDYLEAVAGQGIEAVLAEEEWLAGHHLPDRLTCIAVNDTLRALGDLAAAYRQRYEIPVVGITGSNGKTTCKEMLAAILNQLGSGLKTAGNLNNLIGLPQMLFRLGPEHGWAVLEMGMSEPGEIDRLAEIAAPQVGVVLNAFPAHLESMESIENVARAKGELLLRLPDGGCAVVNADDPLIAAQPSPDSVRRITFGLGKAEIRATAIESRGIHGQSFTLQIGEAELFVRLAAFGRHSIYNALAAAAAAHALGIPAEIIANGLALFRPYDKRFNLEQVGGLILIDDSYNANPASMGAALSTLAELKGDRSAFVALGDMLELGGNEADLHLEIGIQAAQVADRLYLYGPLTVYAAEGAISAGMPAEAVIRGMSHEEIAADILSRAAEGDFILLKGSRGMRMEKVAESIRTRFH
ncbi:MAG: UDP-N-acetylmuramoyl-tripeptide--D-alanyl-D-alanine ligase [Desulfuromonadales bacterium]|nr:UDP-N-acetylmuramoyl-tripeptide--D-alanyl-D-alanine ligase [Desulfuromonadales bacterium]